MAAPQKKGLDYFSFDVDLFEDDKLFDIQNDFGCLGEVIYIRLLCLIYKNGYYYKFNSMDKLCGMMIKSIGNKWIGNKKTVEQVIRALVEVDLFAKSLFPSNVLTSESIQRRYLKACERRQFIKGIEYWLLDATKGVLVNEKSVNVDNKVVNVDNKVVNVDNNSLKEKERKGKENKEKNVIGGVADAPHKHRFIRPTIDEVKAYCDERQNNVDAQRFVNFYESKGWLIGKAPMKDWKAAVRTWESGDLNKNNANLSKTTGQSILDVLERYKDE